MPAMRPSIRMGDMGFGGSTTGDSTNPSKDSIPLSGPPVNVLNATNRLLSNAPVFWLIGILAILGLLKAGVEWKFNVGTGAGIKAGV